MISPLGATNAYSAMQKLSSSSDTSSTSGASGASGGGFGDMVSDALKGVVDNVRQSEQVSASAISGKASLADVVSAVNSADVALKSVVAIRDKVIGAYMDIMKMPI